MTIAAKKRSSRARMRSSACALLLPLLRQVAHADPARADDRDLDAC